MKTEKKNHGFEENSNISIYLSILIKLGSLSFLAYTSARKKRAIEDTCLPFKTFTLDLFQV